MDAVAVGAGEEWSRWMAVRLTLVLRETKVHSSKGKVREPVMRTYRVWMSDAWVEGEDE